MVARLGDFLRYSLYTDSQSPVTVTEELLAVERYLDIERVRFGERLEVSVSMAPEVAGEYIPSMLLQPLVENAIKHAVAPSEDTALLTIEACRRGEFLELRVSDTGSGSEAARPIRDSGVGLRNIRQRLESAYGSAASLEHAYREQGGMTATVRIPTVVAAACA